jgi:hypothetical protein
MKQQRSWCSFLSHKLPLVLMSVTILAVMLIGFLTGGNNTVAFYLPGPFFFGYPLLFSITIVL